MKSSFTVALWLSALTLHASMGSSVQVPPQQHLKYTFGNHKNHPVQKLEEKRYLRSLAPLGEEEIRARLNDAGYTISHLKLCDIASELVYQVHTTTPANQHLKLTIDPANGTILKSEPLQ